MSLQFMHSLISDKMDNRPAYGFSSKLRAAVEKDEDTPSPLDYYADQCGAFGSSGKAFSFGGRFRRRSDISTGPGPGEYHMADVRRKKDKSGRTTFGSRPAGGVWSINDEYVPGPQDYTPYENQGSFYPKKGFSFGQRTAGRRKSSVPGPGEYYTPKAFLFKDTPAYSFGLRNHHMERAEIQRQADAAPSPLDYRPERVNEFGSSSRGWLFGPGPAADQRTSFSKKDAEFEPGPGDYGVGVYRKTKCRQVNKKGFSFGQRFPTLIK